MVSLEEVYLSENKIGKIDGLATLSNLKILDLAYNRIPKLEGLE